MDTLWPAGPTTLQSLNRLDPTEKLVNEPDGTVGVSKLPLAARFAAPLSLPASRPVASKPHAMLLILTVSPFAEWTSGLYTPEL